MIPDHSGSENSRFHEYGIADPKSGEPILNGDRCNMFFNGFVIDLLEKKQRCGGVIESTSTSKQVDCVLRPHQGAYGAAKATELRSKGLRQSPSLTATRRRLLLQ